MDNQNKSTGRFGSAPAGSRPTGSFRSQPAGTYRTRMEYAQERSVSRSSAKAQPAPVKLDSSKNKRRRSKRSTRQSNENSSKLGVWKTLLLGLGVLAVILVVLLVIFGSEPKVHHQLPVVTPPETVEETV